MQHEFLEVVIGVALSIVDMMSQRCHDICLSVSVFV